MHEWVEKHGYVTRIMADEKELDFPGTEIVLVRFKEGKHDHYHKKKIETFYFTKGEGRMVIEGEEKEIKPGSFFLIEPNVKHAIINDSPEILEALVFKTKNSPGDTFMD